MKIRAYADVGDKHISMASHETANGPRYTVIVLNTAARDIETAEVFTKYILAAGTYLQLVDRACGRTE